MMSCILTFLGILLIAPHLFVIQQISNILWIPTKPKTILGTKNAAVNGIKFLSSDNLHFTFHFPKLITVKQCLQILLILLIVISLIINEWI